MMDEERAARVDSPRLGRVVVASYNIHNCVGVDGRRDPQRIVDVIQEMEVDVIGLQEVGGHTSGSTTVDQLAYLASHLQLTPVAGPTLVRETGAYGNALLTRFPILECRRIDLSVGRGEPRGAIDVDLDAHGHRLRVVATHLGLDWRERRKQRSRLGEALADDAGPVVLVGDLNQWWPLGCRPNRPWPGFAAVRCPRTYPSRLPLLSLDRIVARPIGIIDTIAAVSSQLAVRASDHLPLRAVLDLRQ